MKTYINLTKISDTSYQVVFENGVILGSLLEEIDGAMVFYPTIDGGFWEGWVMRLIADELDRLNKDFLSQPI